MTFFIGIYQMIVIFLY